MCGGKKGVSVWVFILSLFDSFSLMLYTVCRVWFLSFSLVEICFFFVSCFLLV